MANIFEGRINRHKGKGRSRKGYIEEMIRKVDCNRYVDMTILAFNRKKMENQICNDKARPFIEKKKTYVQELKEERIRNGEIEV